MLVIRFGVTPSEPTAPERDHPAEIVEPSQDGSSIPGLQSPLRG